MPASSHSRSEPEAAGSKSIWKDEFPIKAKKDCQAQRQALVSVRSREWIRERSLASNATRSRLEDPSDFHGQCQEVIETGVEHREPGGSGRVRRPSSSQTQLTNSEEALYMKNNISEVLYRHSHSCPALKQSACWKGFSDF